MGKTRNRPRSLFRKTLQKVKLKSIQKIFNQNPEYFSQNPKILLFRSTLENDQKGSSTLVITTIDQNKRKILSTYIGDSAYMIFKKINNKYNIYFKSEAQQHGYDFPFQLGTNGIRSDSAQFALENEHYIERGDIILLATDGLFDNMFDEDILVSVNEFLGREEFNGNEICKILAEKSFGLSMDEKYVSPFEIYSKNNGRKFTGGKSDDITIVVGRIE